MLTRFRPHDRRRALALGLIIASTALAAAGVVGIIAALSSGSVELPSEGTIGEIVGETGSQSPQGTTAAETPKEGPPPVRLAIPGLYIDAPVVTETLGADALPKVPGRPDQVAWYDFTAPPGVSSNAVFTGHVDWQTSDGVPIPGVFYRLREMKIGDIIDVTLEDGSSLRYRVTGNVATPYDDPNVVKVMNPTDRDVITVITCGGSWLSNGRAANGGNYSHRIIVRAERVLDLANAAGD
jgi:LPXTG-site transpeptidase (sortase) family protein